MLKLFEGMVIAVRNWIIAKFLDWRVGRNSSNKDIFFSYGTQKFQSVVVKGNNIHSLHCVLVVNFINHSQSMYMYIFNMFILSFSFIVVFYWRQ